MQVGGKPDFADPVVLSADRGGTSIEALCTQIHKSLVADFSYSLVWGTSSKHYPQRCAQDPSCTLQTLPARLHCSCTYKTLLPCVCCQHSGDMLLRMGGSSAIAGEQSSNWAGRACST